MDQLLALLALLSMFGTLGFGLFDWNKTAWCLALISSVLWIVLPILAVPMEGEMIVSYSRIFQPEVAYIVVHMTYNLMILAGIGGTIICVVIGIKWFFRKPPPPKLYMSSEQYRKELEILGFSKGTIEETVQAHKLGLFDLRPSSDFLHRALKKPSIRTALKSK